MIQSCSTVQTQPVSYSLELKKREREREREKKKRIEECCYSTDQLNVRDAKTKFNANMDDVHDANSENTCLSYTL